MTSVSETFSVFLNGIRFDLSAIILSNAPFIFLSLLPFGFCDRGWFRGLLRFLFTIVNSFFFFFNCVDFAYFNFIRKRTSADVFELFTLGSDVQNILPQMVKDFWYVLAAWVLIVFCLIRFYPAGNHRLGNIFRNNLTSIIGTLLIILASTALLIITARGGVQLKPLRIIAASDQVHPANAPLVLNTTFTILKTIGKEQIEVFEFFKAGEEKKYFDSQKKFQPVHSFRPLNIIVIIMESFSAEYTGLNPNRESCTPFLDSLMKESLSFTHAFANGKRSIEGIPAILASIPGLTSEPFITSAYNGNKINSFASLLKNKKYASAFFHGGNNGTMGFDQFSHAAGYDAYFGRNEYGKNDYDGSWGVYDHHFFNFFISKLDEMKPPFTAAFFSISSHHPYHIPSEFAQKFKDETSPFKRSIRYADYSLKLFFEEAKHHEWFDSTLFVITADHTGLISDPAFNNKTGFYSVPLLYYFPAADLKNRNDEITQHGDILPSVLDFINYDEPFVAFGNSIFDTSASRFAINYLEGNYHLVTDHHVLEFDGAELKGLYDIKNDPGMQQNLKMEMKEHANTELKLLQSVLQQFHDALLKNKLAP